MPASCPQEARKGSSLPRLLSCEKSLRACVQGNTCGKSLAPGLPDLVGRIDGKKTQPNSQMFENADANGVFSLEYTTKTWTVDQNSTAELPYALNFTASNSNKIYGQSNTVMPQSVNYAIIIYLGI